MLVRIVRRLALPSARLRVVIYGIHSQPWMAALGRKGFVWRHLPQVDKVEEVDADRGGLVPPAPAGWRTVILPLMEHHALAAPRRDLGFQGSDAAIRLLADKQAFADYAAREGLGALVPLPYSDPAEARFPCVVKRFDLNSGAGVAVAATRFGLALLQRREPFAGHPVLLQAYEPARTEYVTHGICLGGRMIWHRTVRYTLHEGARVRGPQNADMEMVDPPPGALDAFERFLVPLGYDGPCNIDYVVRGDGSLCLFEINPRLGGSLMHPCYVDALADALRTLIAHARPFEAGAQAAA